MATKTLLEVIAFAQSKGYLVDYKETTEGGWTRIRIKKITSPLGKTLRYTGSKGNTALRQLIGQQESVLATAARQQAAERMKGKKMPKRLSPLSKEERALLRKVNAAIKKSGSSAHVSARTYRERKAREGKERAMEALRNDELHFKGYAYATNVAWTYDVVREAMKRGHDFTFTFNYLYSLIEWRKGRWEYKDPHVVLKDKALYDVRLLLGTSASTKTQLDDGKSDGQRDKEMMQILVAATIHI